MKIIREKQIKLVDNRHEKMPSFGKKTIKRDA